MKISGQWNAYTNQNLNFFKEDKISKTNYFQIFLKIIKSD